MTRVLTTLYMNSQRNSAEFCFTELHGPGGGVIGGVVELQACSVVVKNAEQKDRRKD